MADPGRFEKQKNAPSADAADMTICFSFELLPR